MWQFSHCKMWPRTRNGKGMSALAKSMEHSLQICCDPDKLTSVSKLLSSFIRQSEQRLWHSWYRIHRLLCSREPRSFQGSSPAPRQFWLECVFSSEFAGLRRVRIALRPAPATCHSSGAACTKLGALQRPSPRIGRTKSVTGLVRLKAGSGSKF